MTISYVIGLSANALVGNIFNNIIIDSDNNITFLRFTSTLPSRFLDNLSFIVIFYHKEEEKSLQNKDN